MSTGWEISDLMTVLKSAYTGDNALINGLLNGYRLSATNEDFSILLVLRKFKANWNSDFSILNCEPDNGDFQWGITIVRAYDDGGLSQHNVYIPNKVYKSISIKGQEVEIIANDVMKITNVAELSRKLSSFLKITKNDIENGFNDLSNEQYDLTPRLKPFVQNRVCNSKVLGILVYNENLEKFEGEFNISEYKFQVSVNYSTKETFDKVLRFAEAQLSKYFFQAVLSDMAEVMLKLKNEYWLEENEPYLSLEKFQELVKIENINFSDNLSCEISCYDNDIFWGHTIVIDVDEKGVFRDSSLVG